jgi:hypothetical protein
MLVTSLLGAKVSITEFALIVLRLVGCAMFHMLTQAIECDEVLLAGLAVKRGFGIVGHDANCDMWLVQRIRIVGV